MFEADLFKYLTLWKKAPTDHKREMARREIIRLIRSNRPEAEKFARKPNLEDWIRGIMRECLQASNEPTMEDLNDVEIIKQGYSQWQEEFNRNKRAPNKECEDIINKIISFFINRYYVIDQVLKIEDTEDYEMFKNMLKNHVRKYFAEKIQKYLASEEFNSMSYFQKRRKRKQLLKIADAMGQYEINPSQIKEAIG